MSKKLMYLILLCIGATFSSVLFTDHLYADDIAEPASVRGIEIVGGQDVPDPNPYVWQVSINIKDEPNNLEGHNCGGSIIGDKWILTAAHCFFFLGEDDLGPFFIDLTQEDLFNVVLRTRQLSQSNASNEFDIENIEVHRGYDPFRIDLGNDIALIELSEPIPNSEQLIVPLMTRYEENTINLESRPSLATGWGGVRVSPIIGDPPGGQVLADILQVVNLPIVSSEGCEITLSRVFGERTTILDSMICAGFDNTQGIPIEQDTCQGDSGGPLVSTDDNGRFVQTGIVSFGPGCAISFGVYTRVSSFIDWIEFHTGIQYLDRPDLVVQNITVAGNSIEVTIKNQGNWFVPLDHDFWVDVYVNPDEAPAGVNQIWEFQGTHGAVWGVEFSSSPMQPGDTTTLTIGGQHYHEDKSNFPATLSPGDQIYVQIDSANANNDTYGGVMESDERPGAIYNNIRHIIVGQPNTLASRAPEQQTPTTKIYLPMIMSHSDSSGSIQAAMVSTVEDESLGTSLGTNLPSRLR